MKNKYFGISLVIGCFILCMSTSNLDGNWSGNVMLPTGMSVQLKYNFKVVGDQLTGSEENPNGKLPIIAGKISNNEFQFIINANGKDILHKGRCYPDSLTDDFEIHNYKFHVKLIKEK